MTFFGITNIVAQACCGHLPLCSTFTKNSTTSPLVSFVKSRGTFGWNPSHPTPVFAMYNLDALSKSPSFNLGNASSHSFNSSFLHGLFCVFCTYSSHCQCFAYSFLFASQRSNELHFSILTPILAQGSSIRALTYTTQVRSGGSQVCVGNKSHRAEPVSVLRRAPTLTDEQRQQRVGSRASLRPSSCRRARRRDPGKAKDSTFQGPSSCPRESPSTGFDFESTRSNHGKTCKRCTWLHVAPIRMSPWMTDDDPLTKFDNAAALSRK